MKKTILMGGAALLAIGFMTLTAFGGSKTKAQQEAEITQAVAAKVEELRTTKAAECETRVADAAKVKYDEWAAAQPVVPTKFGSTGKKVVPKGKTPPKVDPLPQPTPPTKTPTDAKKDKMQGGTNVDDKKDKMQAQPNTDKKKAKMKPDGGN